MLGQIPGAYYTATDTGSMKGSLMVDWLESCVVPFMPEGESVVLVMDGFKGHLALPFLVALRARNYHVVLRYPHSSHKTQVRGINDGMAHALQRYSFAGGGRDHLRPV